MALIWEHGRRYLKAKRTAKSNERNKARKTMELKQVQAMSSREGLVRWRHSIHSTGEWAKDSERHGRTRTMTQKYQDNNDKKTDRRSSIRYRASEAESGSDESAQELL